MDIMNVSQNLTKINRNFEKLIKSNPRNYNLINLITKIRSQLAAISKLCAQFDYKQIECNGYRQSLHFVTELTNYATELANCELIVEFIEWNLSFVLLCANSEDNRLPVQEYFRFLEEYRTKSAAIDLIVNSGEFPARKYIGFARYGMAYVSPLLAISKLRTIYDYFRFVFSAHFRRQIFLDAIFSADIADWHRFYQISEQRWFRKWFAWLLAPKVSGVKVTEVTQQYPTIYKLQTTINNTIIMTQSAPGAFSAVRVKIYERDCGGPKTKLVLHFTGGGYLGMSPETHESYLLDLANGSADCVIISVDYAKFPHSVTPSALQQIFDLYCNLQLLRDPCEFSHVIFMGDSSGGQLAFSLIAMISDANCQFGAQLRQPNLLIALYASFCMNFTHYPSQLLSTAQLMITPPMCFYACVRALSPALLKREGSGELPAPDDATFALLEHGYNSAINYGNFEQLSATDLLIVTTNCDQYIDCNVQLARSWRGRVHFELFDRLPHGFISLTQVCAHAHKALQLIINKIDQLN